MKNQWQLSLAFAWLVTLCLWPMTPEAKDHIDSEKVGSYLIPVTAALSAKGEAVSPVVFCSVPAAFNASWTPPDDLCPTSPAFDLDDLLDAGATPGGTWTVGGFITEVFNPAIWGVGTHIVTYEVDTGMGVVSNTQNIIINPLPNANWEPPSILCINTLPFPLESMLFPESDPNGTWLIEGQPAAEFNPGLLGEGIYEVSYSVGDPPCVSTLTRDVEIGPLPQADWNAPDTLCTLGAPVDLNDLLEPQSDTDGRWLINNFEIDPVFDPADYGPGDYVITYSVGFFPCDDTETHTVVVSGPTSAAWTAPQPFCQPQDTLRLDDLLDPGSTPGGYWLVNGQLDSIFPPNPDTGVYFLTYRVGPPGCDSEFSDSIVVAASPTADFAADLDTVCAGDPLGVYLTSPLPDMATVTWTLSGGVPSVTPPLDTFLVTWPDPGNYLLELEVSLNGCTAADQRTITVLGTPALPEPSCIDLTTASIGVTWDSLDYATTYEVQIPGFDTLMLDTNYLVLDGLDPDQTVDFIIRGANGQFCAGEWTDTLSCATLPCPDVTLSFTAVDTICLPAPFATLSLEVDITNGAGGAGYWQGPGITDSLSGAFDPLLAGPGSHTVYFIYNIANCTWTDSLTISIYQTPEASFLAEDSICLDDPLAVNFNGTAGSQAVYNWNFDGANIIFGSGAGPYLIEWDSPGSKVISLSVSQFNCVSDLFQQTVQVTEPPAPPVIQCWESPSAIEFFWEEGANTDYELNVVSGPGGAFTSDTSYLLSGLPLNQSVTIELTALAEAPCEDLVFDYSCTTQPCPDVTIDLGDYPPFCLPDASGEVPLTVSLTGNQGSGLAQWQGPGITNPLDGTFSPSLAGPGVHTLYFTYQEGLCVYTDSTQVTVTQEPDPSFTADPVICVTDSATVTYTGDAGPGAVFTWDFAGANVLSGTGAGPYILQWDTPGNRTLYLMVEANGCLSDEGTATVEVEAPLDTPVVNCQVNYSSIEFTWPLDPDPLVEYTVEVLDGPPGSFNTPQSYRLEGLTPGEDYTILLSAGSTNSCPDVSTEVTCTTLPCPQVSIAIEEIAPICLAAAPDAIPLDFTISGDSPLGSLSWSGPGINDPNSNLWTPAPGMAGQQVPVVLTYTEDVCQFSDTLLIDVLQTPVADFSLSSPLCVFDSVLVSFSGLAPDGANYYWDFDDGIASPGTGIGPHWVQWPVAGIKNLSLIVEAEGCASDTIVKELILETSFLGPVVDCQLTFTELSFQWNEYPTSAGYEVVVLDGPQGFFSDETTYSFSGLSPGQEVSIQLTVLSSNTCPAVTVEQTCTTLPCPEVTLDIDEIDPVCPRNAPEVIDLSYGITGDGPAGTITWSGPGIINSQAGLWQWNNGMIGQDVPIVLTYREGPCEFSDTLIIEVLAPPPAAFTAASPVCLTEPALVSLDQPALPGATYHWDYGGGQATPPDGSSPFTVQWSEPGVYQLSLSAEAGGCASDTVFRQVIVEAPLPGPEISCSVDDNALYFHWPQVAGAAGYTVEVLNGPEGMPVADTLYRIPGLTPGQEVTIAVTALSATSCPSVTTEQTCSLPPCPEINLSISPPDTICLPFSDAPLSLDFTLAGDFNGGSLSWNGSGILSSDTNLWQPSPTMAGEEVMVSLTYTEGSCVTTATAHIPVRQRPTADFMAAGNICLLDTLFVMYAGNAPGTATFNWSFSGAEATPGTGAGPHLINWAEAGVQTLSLSVENDGCLSAPFSRTVIVDPPLEVPEVSCEATYNSVVFNWNAIDNVVGYAVSVTEGPEGNRSGVLEYEFEDLMPGQQVGIEIIGVSNNHCPPVRVEQTCSALPCPEVTLSLSADTVLCTGDTARIELIFEGDDPGPFDVDLTAAGQTYALNGISSGEIFTFVPAASTVVSVTGAHLNGVPECGLALPPDLGILLAQRAGGGEPLPRLVLCPGEARLISLADRLLGETPGGTWEEISDNPSSGDAFDAAAGAFQTDNLPPGLYRFRYRLEGPTYCEPAQSIVEIEIDDEPLADAGPDQTLTCREPVARLGSDNTSAGPFIVYNWTSVSGNTVEAPSDRRPTTGAAGTYILRVENTQTGCVDTSRVNVRSEITNPLPLTSVEPVTCHGGADGVIRVDNVLDGAPPFRYGLNDGPLQSDPEFTGLPAGNYVLRVVDDAGCEGTEEIFLPDPPPLEVILNTNLGPDQQLGWGQELILDAIINFPYDSIFWMPEDLNDLGTPLQKRLFPRKADTYSVIAYDEHGCPGMDQVTVYVDLTPNIYIPNVFTPNFDGVNDRVTVFAGPEVDYVERMIIFSRWGEQVFERERFRPNDLSAGWDGTHRGEPMNVGVFTYSVTVRMVNGDALQLAGDVLLLP